MTLTQAIETWIAGPAVPWQRATSGADGKRYSTTRQREYRRHLRACMGVSLMRSTWTKSARYAVRIEYVPQDGRRRDIDNIAKAVLDAANAMFWEDDSQVDRLEVVRQPADARACGLRVRVEVLPG